MSLILIAIHIFVCIALIMIVLLQTGKGADMGAAFGGGSSQTLFGSTGASTFLSKATTAAAIIFMLTSLALAYLSSHRTGGESIMDKAAAPVEQTAPAAPVQSDTSTPEAPAPAEPAKPAQTE
ncbi:MAG: preprotein translocase subunit SecG [Desulfobacterales bacterium]|jgi:preprotein translocase subunit SecG